MVLRSQQSKRGERAMVGRVGQHVVKFGFAIILGAGVMPALAGAQALAQTTQSITPTQTQQVDPGALYEQAMNAEWQGNYTTARQLHERAAQANFGRSHYQLGFLLLDGLGGPRDVEAARFHLRQAADDGITLALVPYLYSYDDQDDNDVAPDAFIAAHTLLELASRDLGMAGDTIQFWSRPMRRQVQVYLQEAGYYRGAIDGLIGQGSLNALRAFARARAPLPELPNQRFERIVVAASGVQSDDHERFAFSQVVDVIDARSAFLGAQVEETVEGHWRIGTTQEALLDWPQVLAADDQSGPVFQLPGKPQRTDFRFDMPFAGVAEADLGVCALRVREPEDGGMYVRRCETRVAGVQLVFEAANGPADDLDAQGSEANAPYGERLMAIELSAPVSLRLAENE
ncbi:MAG: hypothetical protein AB8B88_03915 [Devosiaceae bacterium]